MKKLNKNLSVTQGSILNRATCTSCKCADPCGKCFIAGVDLFDYALIKALNGGNSLSSTVSSKNHSGGNEPDSNFLNS